MAALAVLLSGCVTTQQRNARVKLQAEREIAGREPVRVGPANPDVEVTAVALVRSGRTSAVVVELRSAAATPLTDLPIAVGVRTRHGRRLALNGGRGLGWFQTHVAALAPGGRVTWVVTTRRRVPRGARPYARVGVPGPRPEGRASSLPRLEAGALGSGRVVVRNASDVPQADVPVYAVTRDAGRYVAAGAASVARIGGDGKATIDVPLVGHAEAGITRVYALPTIFK